MTSGRTDPAVYFDDVVPGESYTTATRTISQADIVAFAELTGDMTAIHLDEEFCRNGPFGRPIAHGIMGAALMSGLKSKLRMYEKSSIAALGWERLRYSKPLFAGDTVHARVTFGPKRLSATNPQRGIVQEEVELVNQRGEIVSSGLFSIMLRRNRDCEPVASAEISK